MAPSLMTPGARVRLGRNGYLSVMQDAEMIAQELSALGHKLDDLEKRVLAVEKVNTRLEEAALTTARALGEISGHWDAVYEAMRRKDESQEAADH
jgi:division protein CdvB (Snf7/Vps24/ESCRT-III family)